MKISIKLLSLCFLCVLFNDVFAQVPDSLEVQRDKKNKISYARFKPNSNRTMTGSDVFLKNILKAKDGNEFKLLKDNTDQYGLRHQKYQQYYKGIKVENAQYLVHGKNNIIETVNGDFQEVSLNTVSPITTAQQALVNAKSYVHASLYK